MHRAEPNPADKAPRSGLPAALGAYLIWGFLPLYLILVKSVPPFEFVGWRIIWSVPICLAIVALRGQFAMVAKAIRTARTLGWLVLSGTLIGINWLVYIWAIQEGHVYAASLGYYLNPLLNVVLGTLFLKETLSRRQWVAVAIAALAVGVLAAGAVTTLWISLTLALSFATYGLVRKQVDVGALPGLTIETVILFMPAIALVLWYTGTPAGSAFGQDFTLDLAIIFGGVVTAVPLLLFAIAAKRMKYSTLGFIQYLAPTIVFFLGLTVFGEELQPAQLASFALIWLAVAIFVWDLWRESLQLNAT